MTDGMAVPAANEVASMREAPPPRSKERRAFGGRGDDAPEGGSARTAAMRKDDETAFLSWIVRPRPGTKRAMADLRLDAVADD